MRIIILGLGLIGGSLALALRDQAEIYGVDNDAATREAAVRGSAVRGAYASLAEIPPQSGDLLVLCLHPEGCLEALRAYGPGLPPGVVATDVCGLKGPVTRLAREVLPEGVAFVGGHPMAGREKGGFANADAALLRGAHYLYAPQDAPPEAVERVLWMIRAAGALPKQTDPETHDRMVAYTSQMMHILALAVCEQDALLPSIGYEGGSFAGATRVAALDERLWMQLFWPNRDALCGQVDELIGKLAEYRDLLRQDDAEALRARVRSAVRRKEAYNDLRERSGEHGGIRDFD